MKTYRNKKYGFEFDIPDEWSQPDREARQLPSGESITFGCSHNESFYLLIAPLPQNYFPGQAELVLRKYALGKGGSNLQFGNISVQGKEHIWVRYYAGYGRWTKRYRLDLSEIEYLITASCIDNNTDQRILFQRQEIWDIIVKSFRSLGPIKEPVMAKGEAFDPLVTADESLEKESQETIKPKNQFIIPPAIENEKVSSNDLTIKLSGRMKTYRNEKHRFEIDIPETWAPAPELPPGLMDALTGPIPPGINKDCFQYGCYDEAMNFEITPLSPEPLLEDTEIEFKMYARDNGFTDLRFGRIVVAGKEHVCASYFIDDVMGKRWNKKYMLDFGGMEYSLTATCNDPHWFAKREKEWDAIIKSFHVLTPVNDSINATDKANRERQERREIIQERLEMRRSFGELFARAYEAITMGQYEKARVLLEECLRAEPNHIQAHQKMALVLHKMGDISGATHHLREVERLDPTALSVRSAIAELAVEASSGGNLFGKAKSITTIDRSYSGPKVLSRNLGGRHGIEEKIKQDVTLAFSSISYLLIATFAFVYIHYRVGIAVLLTLNSESHQPLSSFEFNVISFVLLFGIGASVCLIFLLGVVVNSRVMNNVSSFFDFTEKTMQTHDEKNRTIGSLIFSDYTHTPHGVFDTLRLLITTTIHALIKIISLPFTVGLLNPALTLIFALLLILPKWILRHPLPTSWDAVYFLFLFIFCYRAQLFLIAKRRGIARIDDRGKKHQFVNSSINLSMQAARSNHVTPDYINKILSQESVINIIRNDLLKTDKIGYKEIWRLGLITSEQDWFDPNPDQAPILERTKRFFEDRNYRLKWVEQIPLRKAAVLHNPLPFGIQFNNLYTIWGNSKPVIYGFPVRSHSLSTRINKDEYIPIRNIQVAENPTLGYRSMSLAHLLQKEGFPLKESYIDGDPLTTERGGIIVIDKDNVIVIYPRYFVQRRLIDDEGNLVDLGIDENFSSSPLFEVKMRPSVSRLLIQEVSRHGYTPIVRYRSFPYKSEFMLPILDTPMSCNGWADLYIDLEGKARLFIAKEKTTEEWYEMMNRLRQLLYDELAKKNYHLLGLTKDKTLLNHYLAQKLEILKDYFIVQNWRLF